MDEKKIKITLLGNTGVGKTCIISKFINDEFPENPNNVSIANYSEKTINRNKKDIKLDIWNSIGIKKFECFGKYFYKDSNIVCFVYDITNSESFIDIKNIWYPEFYKNGDKNTILGMVGNKSDLYENEVIDLYKEAKKFSEIIGAHFMIISAKTGNGIQKLFDTLVDLYLNNPNKNLKEIGLKNIDSYHINNIINNNDIKDQYNISKNWNI